MDISASRSILKLTYVSYTSSSWQLRKKIPGEINQIIWEIKWQTHHAQTIYFEMYLTKKSRTHLSQWDCAMYCWRHMRRGAGTEQNIARSSQAILIRKVAHCKHCSDLESSHRASPLDFCPCFPMCTSNQN